MNMTLHVFVRTRLTTYYHKDTKLLVLLFHSRFNIMINRSVKNKVGLTATFSFPQNCISLYCYFYPPSVSIPVVR